MEDWRISWKQLNNSSQEEKDALNNFLKECEELVINMKPEIGQRVYCIYGDGILVDNIAFIGNESFIIKSFGSSTYEDSWEWYYEDYEEKWFTNLKKAKEKLISIAEEKYKEKCIIKKYSDDWYELVEVD